MLRVRFQPASALDRLQQLARRLSTPAELLAPALPVVARAIERNFDEEGRPLPWPPLSPAYLRRKSAGLKILQLSGRLRRSIRVRLEGNAIVASTDLPYAAAHQFGFPRRNLPARPFLVLTDSDRQEAAQTILNKLVEN